MTRVCVKNLPKHLTEQRLKAHFEKLGEITDVKILKTKDGKSRLIGFVGFKTQQDASKALKYFNNTYIDTSKITIEEARKFGDDSVRPWSKYSKGSSTYEKKHMKPETKKPIQEGKDGSIEKKNAEDEKKLRDFLSVVAPKKDRKLWVNDDGRTSINMTADTDTVPGDEEPAKKKRKIAKAPKVVISHVPAKRFTGGKEVVHSKMHVKFDGSDEEMEEEGEHSGEQDEQDEQDEQAEQADGIQGKDEQNADPVINDTTVSDLDYLKSKKTLNLEELEDEMKASAPKEEEDKSAEKRKTWGKGKRDDEEEEDLGESGRLFVRNLPFTTTHEDLQKLFEQYGILSEVHLPIDKETSKAKGFAYVLYMIPEDAIKAHSALDGSIFQGRLMHVLPARSLLQKPPSSVVASENSSFKKSKTQKMVETAQKAYNWNSLFMRSDTVADAFVDKHGINKSDIFDPTSANMASNLALMETQIIHDTKKFFEEEGINLDILNNPGNYIQRSDSVLLVKNLPYDTTEQKLKTLFGPYGELGRVLLPPSRTIGIVEFVVPNDAKQAFRALAYRKFKNVPIFLEWAPVGFFVQALPEKNASEATQSQETKPQETDLEDDGEITKVSKAKKPEASTKISASEAPDDQNLDKANTSVYIKNLSFGTTEETLKEVMKRVPDLRRVSVATHRDNKGNVLSSGYGFAIYKTKEAAIKAIKELQGTQVDGFNLEMRMSTAKPPDKYVKPRKPTETKPESSTLIVRNLPFEANAQDLRNVFSVFGQIKSLRIPQKATGQHSGFGFVEFLTKQEATKALESVKHTHLYGRHLVLEFAEESMSLDNLRKKTAKHFLASL